MRVDLPKLFDIASVRDKTLVQKIGPLIDYVNQLADQFVRIVNGKLRLSENVEGQIRVIKMKHNVELAIDFLDIPKTTRLLVLDVSDFDAVTALRRNVNSKNQLVLKATFADASADSRVVTLFLLP